MLLTIDLLAKVGGEAAVVSNGRLQTHSGQPRGAFVGQVRSGCGHSQLDARALDFVIILAYGTLA
jgi:hypothetical protein